MSTYSIQILVLNGRQDGIKIFNRPVDWSGEIITFPRSLAKDVKEHIPEGTNGVYILWSKEGNEYSVYVGKSDNIISRIQQHVDGKNFWTNAVVLISSNNILNSAHVGWIESNLVQKVKEVSRHKVVNGNQPSDPKLNLQDKVLAATFLSRLEEMLPIMGLPLFDPNDDAITPDQSVSTPNPHNEANTILVPTGKFDDGFEQVFLNEHSWYYLRISSGKLDRFKYIAAYQPAPVSAVTHIAEIETFTEIQNEKGQPRLKAVFKGPAQEISPIPFGSAKGGSLQGPRYVNRDDLLLCKDLGELL